MDGDGKVKGWLALAAPYGHLYVSSNHVRTSAYALSQPEQRRVRRPRNSVVTTTTMETSVSYRGDRSYEEFWEIVAATSQARIVHIQVILGEWHHFTCTHLLEPGSTNTMIIFEKQTMP